MKKVAIIQSSFLPWKGYFDIIHDVDTFIFLEDVQYTKNDWRNRNKIKLVNGQLSWITVPVLGGISQKIDEVRIDKRQKWSARILKTLQSNYARAKYFKDIYPMLEELLNQDWEYLSALNMTLIKEISRFLGLDDKEWLHSRDFQTQGVKDDKVLDLLRQVKADYYLSGPSAQNYIDEQKFKEAGIVLAYKDYSGYPEYTQVNGSTFEHHVSIVDLLFNLGPEAPYYIWGWRTVGT